MARLILFLLLFASAVLAIVAVMALLNPAGGSSASAMAVQKKEDTMPATFRTVAYVLLMILMLGVATGWLGQT